MAVAYTLAVTDQYSRTIFTRASLAASTTYNIWYDNDATPTSLQDFPFVILRKPLSGNATITVSFGETGFGTVTGYAYI